MGGMYWRMHVGKMEKNQYFQIDEAETWSIMSFFRLVLTSC
jgi:hypothetical protein